MLKKLSSKILIIFLLSCVLTVCLMPRTTSGLLSQNSTSWFTLSDTNSVAIVVGDVNNDGTNEIVSGGYYNDGVNWNGQLVVLNATTMTVEASAVWRLGSTTNVAGLAIGDINGDGKTEIATAGSYFDGTNWIGQLITWNGTTLAPLGLANWRLGVSTTISSVAIANVSSGVGLDIITGATIFDGVNDIGQVVVWNGTTLAPERQAIWRLGVNTFVGSVAVGNASLGNGLEIITGGQVFDGTNNIAQMIIWNATNLAFERLINWRLGTDNYVNSMVVANVSQGSTMEIVSGGEYFDGSAYSGQIIVWNATTLTAERMVNWRLGLTNTVSSVTVGNFSGGATLDIVSAGTTNDTIRKYGQVLDWNSATLIQSSVASWYVTSDTSANSVAIGNISGFGTRIVAGGQYWDGFRANAQVTLWG
jgi:hypothetical protein